MRKWLFAIMLVLITGYLIYFSSVLASKTAYEKTIISAFKDSNAEILSSNISFKGLLHNEKLDKEYWQDIKGVVLNTLGTDLFVLEQGENTSDTYKEYWVIAKSKKGNHYRISAWLEKKDKTEDRVGYIKLDYYQDNIYKNIEIIRENIDKAISPYCAEMKIISTITGTYSEKLEQEDIEAVTSRILKKSKAKKVFYDHGKDIIDVFAYSPLYGESIVLRDKKSEYSSLYKIQQR